MMGKILAAVVIILGIWASLAQIAPQWFQMRPDNRLKDHLWGQNTKWVALMLSSILIGIYIWNLENRFSEIVEANETLHIDQTGLGFITWTPSEKVCAAIINASKVPTKFRNKYEVALICGISDPAVDKFKDDRITVSSLFTIQDLIPITVSNSAKMTDAIAGALDTAMRTSGTPKGTHLTIAYMMWFRAVLLPQKFDMANIHTLTDVSTHGGEIYRGEPGATVAVTRTAK